MYDLYYFNKHNGPCNFVVLSGENTKPSFMIASLATKKS